jgi:hypothetical protein
LENARKRRRAAPRDDEALPVPTARPAMLSRAMAAVLQSQGVSVLELLRRFIASDVDRTMLGLTNFVAHVRPHHPTNIMPYAYPIPFLCNILLHRLCLLHTHSFSVSFLSLTLTYSLCIPHLLPHHMQMRAEALEHRTGVERPPNGSWEDVVIVLTHVRLPLEYRRANYSAASGYLRDLRGGTSAAYNRLGNYMLQIESLGFEHVLTMNYEDCGPPLEAIWRAHLASVAAEQGGGGDGFTQNKPLPILGGSIADLARRIPNATFADVLPPHLLPSGDMQLVPVPQPMLQPLNPMPQPLPQPLAQPVPQPLPQPMPQPLLQPLAQPVPQPLPDLPANEPSNTGASTSGTTNESIPSHPLYSSRSLLNSSRTVPLRAVQPTPQVSAAMTSTSSRRSIIPAAGALPIQRGGARTAALDLTALLNSPSPAAAAARDATAPQSGA